jgi:hypothetical protein
MAAEENELDELQSQMERVVGPGPAATLMRHLNPVPWPDVATKADLTAVATKADLESVATKADLESVATKADLESVATKADLESVATKADLESVATKADLESVATKTDLEATKTEVSAIRTDIGEIRTDVVRLDTAMQVGFATLESSLIQRMNTQTITMIFALVAVVASISSVALFR